MFRLPGAPAKDLCDAHLGATRRDFLRVGGSGMLGLTLNQLFRAQAAAEATGAGGGPGDEAVQGVSVREIVSYGQTD